MLDLQEHMEKIILELETLKRSTCLNMHRLREEHDEALNAANENGTTENIEELDKLSQTLEDKIYFLQLILLVILNLYNHMYQVLIYPEFQVNNMLRIYKKKYGQHFNKLNLWKLL